MRPWNVVFLMAFLAFMAIRAIYARRMRSAETAVSRVDWRERALLGLVLSASLILPLLYLCTDWLAFADDRPPRVAPWCGTAAMAAALWLFWRSHADLGTNWSVTLELRKDHHLVRHGVYRTIRHPMYAATWLFTLGQGLLLANWLAGWSAFVAFGLLYLVRVPREERMMCDAFGEAYREYAQQTGRLVPRMRRSARRT